MSSTKWRSFGLGLNVLKGPLPEWPPPHTTNPTQGPLTEWHPNSNPHVYWQDSIFILKQLPVAPFTDMD